MTSDDIYKYVSNMGNNLTPFSVATGSENYYLLTPNFSFIKKDKIDYNTILNGIYVPESDLLFEKLELCKIHSNYDNDNDDENDDNQIVIIFKLIVMIVEILFILHVANGILIIIPQWWYSICTLIQILFSENIFIEQHFSTALSDDFFNTWRNNRSWLVDDSGARFWLTVHRNVLR